MRILLLLSLLFVVSCGIRTKDLTAVKYYRSFPVDSTAEAYIPVPAEKIIPFLKAAKRHSAYLPKGSFGYIKLEYGDGKESMLFHAIPGRPYPFTEVDNSRGMFTAKWYEIGDSAVAAQWGDLLRSCSKEFEKKYGAH